jgi:hypothetical protein
MAAAAELTPASVSRDSAAETDVRGVLAPVVDTDALPETDALAACELFKNDVSIGRERHSAGLQPFQQITFSANLCKPNHSHSAWEGLHG